MRVLCCGTVLLSMVLALSGCDNATSSSGQNLVMEGKTMGTVWRVTVADVPASRRSQLQQVIQQQLDNDDQELSTWKTDSALSRFNQYTGTRPWPVSEAMADIVTMALRIGAKTGGAMDITVGPLVNLWGFGPEKMPAHTPAQQQIDQAKARTGLRHLKVIQTADGQALQKDLPDLYVDLSTMGEGYATDHLARLMESQGITNYLVSVGGALLSRGHTAEGKPWRVAIQKPTDLENEAQAVVDLQGHGISTSGDYRNYYELDGQRISHIIDPATGRPIEHKLASATVIATTAGEADGWDTGLMVLGTEKAKALALKQHLAVFLITRNGDKFESWASPLFKSFLLTEAK
ncbi:MULTISPECIES: FAD:protein FMN transferase ApbE [Tatumella]|uniref:FAD:protein FMN transferase n=1 Tax=Tatumella punctata TaxID=399969 RepID=A0ABW1VPE0_9GAMM|nr:MULTISPECIES: FAD:protein FMN transferase ApbE [unclassified Tatumella]MBS0854850.1 FAD:protein FMN transferase ApbE [Tatumella sp. JGM16]MBS0876463.1 FAD:protein FMN transferase ApbE [Tatumella sp. JGM82]MBS0889636.1 FAD:protein FMN transferase ApbE [Tatumella sp. JGM94]MBS0893006.1 FAD:protein FMN transferase ApbE [Tatumella sp. JGM130]MBS0900758.1 FAD:protein FMN transferase ApbE [Tatumella sp. JGM100]